MRGGTATSFTLLYSDSLVPIPYLGGRSDIGVVFRIEFAPELPRAVSRKTHGSAGNFDIDLPLAGAGGIECRTGGASDAHQIVIEFPAAVTFVDAAVTSGTGNVSNTSGNGTVEVTINLSGVTNAQTVTLTLFGVNDGTNTNDVAVPMSILAGDTTADGSVNASDISQTKSQSGQAVARSNFRTDVTVKGFINNSDIGLAKSNSGSGLP